MKKLNIELYCLRHHITFPYNSPENTLFLYENRFVYNTCSSFDLYDTDNNSIKLLCWNKNRAIECNFIKIEVNMDNNQSSYELSEDNNLVFASSNNFTEKI